MESRRPICIMGSITVGKSSLDGIRVLLALTVLSLLPLGLQSQCIPLPDQGTMCAGDMLELQGNPAGSGVYTSHQWEVLPFSTAAGLVLNGQETEVLQIDASSPDVVAGTLYLQYTVVDTNGCEGSALTSMIIKPLPQLEILGEQVICHGGEAVIFSCALTENGWYESNAPEGFANMGDGKAILDPALCTPGIYTITYAATQDGCTHSVSLEVEVMSCESELLNACTCRPDANNVNGNATEAGNGQFQETILFYAPPNQNWYLSINDGLYETNSPQPPAVPVLIPEGTELTETSPGLYALEGIHMDELGYQITVTNGADVISASNSCFYPATAIQGLDETYCAGDGPIPLEGTSNGASGAGTFSIYSENGEMLQNNITILDPGSLGMGDYMITFQFDQSPDQAPCTACYAGCVQTVSQAVTIVDQDEVPVCNNLVQISMDGDCEVELLADMVLEGTYGQLEAYLVEIFQGVNNLGSVITIDMIDNQYPVMVTNTCTGNTCWGSIQVEDKWLPEITCPSAPVQIPCLADVATVAVPEAVDNCDGPLVPALINESIVNMGCEGEGGIVQQITQTWGATDGSGNAAIPCEQIIEVVRPTLNDIQLPPNRDGIQAPAISCEDPQLDPSVTGYPSWNGYPVFEDNGICGISSSYTDVVLDACGNTFKVVRTWTILDDCADGELLTGIQVIKVADETPPMVDCPASLTVNAGGNCQAVLNLPPATITDNCNTWTVTVTGPDLFLNGNGGQLSGLDLGDYLFEYRVTDACNNVAVCNTIVHIEDGVAPAVVCDSYTVVALEVDGEAIVPSEIFDDGSYDFCTPVSFLGRRMDQPAVPFTEDLLFTCADLENDSLMVVIQVSDENGNSNTCMVEVEVQDKIPPVVTCPPNMTLDCASDFSDVDLVGEPTVLEGCAYELLYDEQVALENGCNYGTVTRTFTAVDSSGNQGSCTQLITLEITDPFTEDDIEWPADFTAPECTDVSQLEPDSLPTGPENYQRPIIHGQNCALIGINYEDEYFDITSPACFKIVRTWRIIDWCQFDLDGNTGYWEHEQVIKVVDNQPPEITCAFTPFMKLTEPHCYDTVMLEVPVVTDCSPDVEIFAESDLGTGFGPFLDVPLGEYEVTYTVIDNCGNAAVCTYTLHVVDGKAPTPFCENGIVAELMQTGMVDLNVKQLDAGSFDNCTPADELLFSFSHVVYDTVRTYMCQNEGSNTVEVWVTDEEGNQDYCEVDIYIQDNFNVCPPAFPLVAGAIVNENGEGVNETEVSVNGLQSGVYLTGSDGLYEVFDLEEGGDYTIVPEKTGDWLNGVSTYDLALISKHVLQLELLDSPYKIIAADANRSGSITTLDLVTIQKVILLIQDEFPNNTSWRFVPADYEFLDPSNPLAETFPEVININNLAGSLENQDFIAVKVGDVSGNASAGFQQTSERTTGVPCHLLLSDKQAPAGSYVELDIKLKDIWNWAALQYTMEFDPAQLEFASVKAGVLDQDNLGLRYAEEGQITFAWHEDGQPLLDEERLISLVFRVMEPVILSKSIRISSSRTEALAYKAGGIASPVYAYFESSKPAGLLELTARPNPFSGNTLIEYWVGAESEVQLRITDLAGRLIWESRGVQQAGKHQVQVGSSELSRPGVYHLTLATQNGTVTKKIIKL